MRRRPAVIDRVFARPCIAATIATISLVGIVAATAVTLGVGQDDVLTTGAADVDAARLATSSPATTTSAEPTTTTSSTTSIVPATTTAAPTMAPPTTTPVPATTARPTTTPPPATPEPTAAPMPEPAAVPAPPPSPGGTRCLVRLHGKGGDGAQTTKAGDVTVIAPAGNAAGWGGKQWLYFAPASYESAIGAVAQAVDANGCGQVIVDGFSNGGAFAVKLYCRGESFGGRLVTVVADDPVPDHGADACSPAPGVALTMYWTGALTATAQPGWSCAEQDWTCEGGTTVGIGTYAANAGTSTKKSPYGNHQWYMDAPELTAWR